MAKKENINSSPFAQANRRAASKLGAVRAVARGYLTSGKSSEIKSQVTGVDSKKK